MTQLPSIRSRLANALLFWLAAWAVSVAAAVWLVARHEVEELLDDTLRPSAELLGTLLGGSAEVATAVAGSGTAALPELAGEHFAWQLVGADGRLRVRSSRAPSLPLISVPAEGFSDVPDWRVFGLALGPDRRMLYVAQSSVERREAQAEVAFSAGLATLAIGLLGHIWLRTRMRRELEPLRLLSERLARHDPVDMLATLGPAERRELQPVHAAIDDLGRRLARRVGNERAFAAHAAHALRTPLAGIDAQLAVALRECPAALQPRLQRVREAAGRLQRVVAALLGLFRTGAELQRRPVDLAVLLPRLPIEGLTMSVPAGAMLDADPDLLAAALLNLLDNSLRHGASRVVASVPRAGVLRLHDDGEGIGVERRDALQSAIDSERYEGRTGFGLMLADRVARSHGGALLLLAVDAGFGIEMRLGDPAGAAALPQQPRAA